ncbi:MAG: hypothetical protein CMO81_02305 [Waddliaceae bacterium]|nr:hypothetical protein [Waddliaceae bacterium]
MKKIYLFLLGILMGGTGLVGSVVNAETWTPEQVLQMKRVSDVQVSVDGQVFAAVGSVETVDGQLKRVSNLFSLKSGKEEKILGDHEGVRNLRFSPDGKKLAFIDTKDKIAQIFLFDIAQEKVLQITSADADIHHFIWSPDGTQIAFVMEEKITEEKKSKIRVHGDFARQSIWLINIDDPEQVQRLTNREYHVRGMGDFGDSVEQMTWSPDGKEITFAHVPKPGCDDLFMRGSLATVDLETGEVREMPQITPYMSNPIYSPDGTHLAFLVSDEPTSIAIVRYVTVMSVDTGEVRKLAVTPNEGPFLAGTNLLGWTAESDGLLFLEPYKTMMALYYLSIDGESAQRIDDDTLFINGITLGNKGKTLVFSGQTLDLAPEIYQSSLKSFKAEKLSSFNQEISSLEKAKTQCISWLSSDGTEIEGLLTFPQNYEEGKKYPLLLLVHGGPMGSFMQSFVGTPYPYPALSFAEKGYFVLRPNPRGSTGYGASFRKANFSDWGGMDYKDLMFGVDELIEQGLVDENRMGLMGWSYGGYMTAWAVTQTSRFQAASMGAGISNLLSFTGTTDLHSFLSSYCEGDIWEKTEHYWGRSPIAHVRNVQTPLLIQHGEKDTRVPFSQSQEYFQGLKRLGKDVEMESYPEAGHGIEDPEVLLDVMKRNLVWFEERV